MTARAEPERAPAAPGSEPERTAAAVGAEPASAPGYHPRRTLPLRVEIIRQLRRRRTLVAFGILTVLPWILVGAFEVSGTEIGRASCRERVWR